MTFDKCLAIIVGAIFALLLVLALTRTVTIFTSDIRGGYQRAESADRNYIATVGKIEKDIMLSMELYPEKWGGTSRTPREIAGYMVEDAREIRAENRWYSLLLRGNELGIEYKFYILGSALAAIITRDIRGAYLLDRRLNRYPEVIRNSQHELM